MTDAINGSVGDCEVEKKESNTSVHVVPTNDLMCWDRHGAVRLRMTDTGPRSMPPETIMSALQTTAKRAPDRPALAVKENGKWMALNYAAYLDKVRCAAKAFIKLGLEARYGVGIMGFNSPEWFIANLASIMAGGIATGIYTTNSAEACFYVLDNADCQIVVIENDQMLKKILEVRDRLPHLKTIVIYKGKSKEKEHRPADILTWDAMMAFGEGKDDDLDDELEKRIAAQAPNQCSTLIYTSGTTGNPKGAMLSHDNLIWTAKMLIELTHCPLDVEMVVSYLPLSHIAAQLLDIYIPLVLGATVHFAQPDALKGSLKNTLVEIRPTIFLGVPRVWEKMQEGILAAGRSVSNTKKRIFAWARNIGLRSNLAQMRGGSRLLCFPLANKLVFSKVRAALGLDRCKFLVSGAAPITKETLEFFLSLNIQMLEVYGMSESSGPHTLGLPWALRVTSVGREFPGSETRLVDVDKDVSGDGEICMNGRHVFMGYLNMPEKTKEAMDEDGWLHSGDIGRKDKDGFLYVTGRLKELLITAGGENVPPVPIEDKVKEVLPCVSNCMLIGDKRKFLSMLLTLKTEINPDTNEPTDRLSGQSVDWCRSIGSKATSILDIVDDNDQLVLAAIQKGIDAVNKTATSRAQCIQKWTLLRSDFTISGGELGPTLKLKRPEVLRLHATTIDTLYEEGNNPVML